LFSFVVVFAVVVVVAVDQYAPTTRPMGGGLGLGVVALLLLLVASASAPAPAPAAIIISSIYVYNGVLNIPILPTPPG